MQAHREAKKSRCRGTIWTAAVYVLEKALTPFPVVIELVTLFVFEKNRW